MIRKVASLVLTASLLLAGQFPGAAQEPPTVAELLAKLPASGMADGQQLAAEIVKQGPDGIRPVIASLVPAGQGDDAKARFALNGLAFYVGRPGAETERALFSGLLIEAMEAAQDVEVKTFLVSLLQLVGKDEAVAPLGRLLLDAHMCDPAARALVSLRARDTVSTLLQALPRVDDASRVHLIRALGATQARAAAKAVLPYAQSKDTHTRRAALYALAQAGDPIAAGTLAQAAAADTSYERAHATALYLTYARRRAELGDRAGCAAICRGLIKTRAAEPHVVCDALAVLTGALGDAALGDLLAALDSDSKPLRVAALNLMVGLPRWAVAENEVRVMISRGMGLAINGMAVTPRDLPAALQSSAVDKNARVIVWAVPGVPYAEVAKVLDVVKRAGFTRVGVDLSSPLEGGVTKILVARMQEARPEVRAEIVSALARRDAAAQPVVLAALKDPEQVVRLAAVSATARFGTPQAIQALIAALSTDRPDEAKAIREALARIPGEKVLAAAAAALPKAAPTTRVSLLQLLAARRATAQLSAVFDATRDADAAVRLAAIQAVGRIAGAEALPQVIALMEKAPEGPEQLAAQEAVIAVCQRNPNVETRVEPVLAALAPTTGEQRILFLEMLPQVGGGKALQAVVAETKSADAEMRDAAIRALADWEDVAAAPELLNVARTAESQVHQVLALRGYVRVVGASSRPAGEKVRLLQEALTVAKRPDEKKLVLGGLSTLRTVEALQAVAPALDDPELVAEASMAAVRIALPQDAKQRPLSGAAVVEVLRKVAAVAPEAKVRAQAQAYLDQLPKSAADEQGFVSLFNGKDLTGWVGATKGYAVENGVLVCLPQGGGKLMTEKEYRDFRFRFEFKLPPGANNGVGIRAPLEGDAAYNGMEIQILDDTAERYRNLKPYQFHGSVYGVAPAKKGHLKPVGEWNAQEIIAKGRRVTVILNGVTIVDVDLDQVSTPRTLDGREHPGLKNEKGHIGFLGHGARIEFRNIRIQEL